MYRKEFMEVAVKEAREGTANGDGGPFGAVMGGRAGLPEGFMEERGREMCLEVFQEYEGMNGARY